MTFDRRRFTFALASLAGLPLAGAQSLDDDLAHAARLRERGLADTLAWSLIESLVSEVGARPAGSANDARAVEWALAQLRRLGFAKVRADAVTFNIWQRGAESAQLIAPYPHRLVVSALGNSVPTADGGIEARGRVVPRPRRAARRHRRARTRPHRRHRPEDRALARRQRLSAARSACAPTARSKQPGAAPWRW